MWRPLAAILAAFLFGVPALAQQPPAQFPFTQDKTTGAWTAKFPLAITVKGCNGANGLATDANGFFTCQPTDTGPVIPTLTPGTYTLSTVTVNPSGYISNVASGSAPVSCSGIAAGSSLFSDGSTCQGNPAHYSWDNTTFRLSITADPGVLLNQGFGIDLIGGNNNRGGAMRVRQSAGGGSLRIGYSDLNGHSYLDSRDATDTVNHLTLNRGVGGSATVSINTDLAAFVAQPAQYSSLNIDPGGNSRWWLGLGAQSDWRGGLFLNANSKAELRFFNTGGAETVKISGDSTSASSVPNRFTAPGLTDSTVTGCSVVSTNGSGNLGCAGSSVISGTVVNGEVVKGTGTNTIGTTGLTLPPAPASTQCLHVSSSGSITATGADCNTGGGGGVQGLFGWSLSPTPTAASTGLNTWVHQNSNTVADSTAGITIGLANAGVNDSWSFRCKAAPTPPYTIFALMSLPASGGNESVGIGWADGLGATPKLSIMRLFMNAAIPSIIFTNYTNPTTFSANIFSLTWPSNLYWTAIRDDNAGNIVLYSSADGKNYQLMSTILKSTGFLGATGYSNICFGGAINGAVGFGTLISYAQQSGAP